MMIIQNKMLLFVVAVKAHDWPNGVGCVSSNAKELPYCDESLDLEARLVDLSERLTRSELASRLRSDAMVPSIERLGLPEFNYRVEAVHGLEAYCWGDPMVCPTSLSCAEINM